MERNRDTQKWEKRKGLEEKHIERERENTRMNR